MPEILNATAIASANVTGPAFVVVPIGDGRSGWPHMGLYAKNVSKMLIAAKPHGRAVYILTPRDLQRGASTTRRCSENGQRGFIGKQVHDCASATGAPAP